MDSGLIDVQYLGSALLGIKKLGCLDCVRYLLFNDRLEAWDSSGRDTPKRSNMWY